MALLDKTQSKTILREADDLISASGIKESVLQEADRLVSTDRQQDYGHPLDDFTKTAKMWSAVLGQEVSPEQVPLCMILVKISRETNRHKRDNLVDIAGYAKTLKLVVNEKEKRSREEKALKAQSSLEDVQADAPTRHYSI